MPGCCTAASGCDDNNKCTVDTCEKGQCVATPITCTGSLCEDALCEPQTGVCGLTVKAGKCKIDNTCYDDKDVKADDVCLWCASASNKGGWTLKAVCKCVAGACCDVPANKFKANGIKCGETKAVTEYMCSSAELGGKVMKRTAQGTCPGDAQDCSTAGADLSWSGWAEYKQCTAAQTCLLADASTPGVCKVAGASGPVGA